MMLQVTNKQQIKLPPAPAYNLLTKATAKPGKPLAQSSGQQAVLQQPPVPARTQPLIAAIASRPQISASVQRDSQLPSDLVVGGAAEGDVANPQQQVRVAAPAAMQIGPKLSFKRIRRAK